MLETKWLKSGFFLCLINYFTPHLPLTHVYLFPPTAQQHIRLAPLVYAPPPPYLIIKHNMKLVSFWGQPLQLQ